MRELHLCMLHKVVWENNSEWFIGRNVQISGRFSFMEESFTYLQEPMITKYPESITLFPNRYWGEKVQNKKYQTYKPYFRDSRLGPSARITKRFGLRDRSKFGGLVCNMKSGGKRHTLRSLIRANCVYDARMSLISAHSSHWGTNITTTRTEKFAEEFRLFRSVSYSETSTALLPTGMPCGLCSPRWEDTIHAQTLHKQAPSSVVPV